MMGSGGLIVMDEDTCMVDIARFFLDFTVDESCGKCTPCRVGTRRMLEILEQHRRRQGRMEGDIEKLEELATTIKATALCGLGQTAPNPVLSTLKFFRDEYEAHMREKRCPAHHCQRAAALRHLSDKCRGCTACATRLPGGRHLRRAAQARTISTPASASSAAPALEKCKFGAITRRM